MLARALRPQRYGCGLSALFTRGMSPSGARRKGNAVSPETATPRPAPSSPPCAYAVRRSQNSF